MALYQNDQEAPARIRSLIGQAIGSDAALVNDVLLSAHNERTDRSRKKDFEAGPARDAAGKVQWSDNSTNLMRALRLRTLFMSADGWGLESLRGYGCTPTYQPPSLSVWPPICGDSAP